MSAASPVFPGALDLAGRWRHELDRADIGVDARWFARELGDAADLPGSLPAQGLGDPVTLATTWTGTIFDPSLYRDPAYAAYREPGNLKLPFWLQPGTEYVGAAWYQRDFEIPKAWRGRRVVLFLERPHWFTRAWLDGTEIGGGDSLATPHELELGDAATPGRHRLTLRVDNRLHVNVGENAHSVSDHTQGNWNGVIGRVELRATGPAWIADLQVYPRVAGRSAEIRGRVSVRPGHDRPAEVRLSCPPGTESARAPVAADGTFAATLALGPDAATWDEFSPVLHELVAALPDGEERRVKFGLREVAIAGTRFLINGRPLFLRGTLDNCVFPLTGHPPMEPDDWRRVLGRLREFGLNHVRFHSWCPPEAAFAAADELGLYLHVECGAWANTMLVKEYTRPATIGDGGPVDAWIHAETERILREYGNHPSFVLLAHGNEPGGPRHEEFLAAWARRYRGRDPRRLCTAAAGWPELPDSEFQVLAAPRLHQWGDGLASRLNAQPPATTADHRAVVAQRDRPAIGHEIGQWCAYPDLADAPRYTGHLKARSLEVFAESLAAHHLGDRAAEFVQASGRLQVLCYKEEIETSLRTPGLAGFQLLGLQDFPGQGTAPVGVIDAFWEPKRYAAAAEFRRFCAPTVLLARLARRVFTTADTLEAELEVAHFGAAPLAPGAVEWRVEDDHGQVHARGQLAHAGFGPGGPLPLGRVSCPLTAPPTPCRCRLVAELPGVAANDWEIWIYPEHVDATVPPGVQVITWDSPASLASVAAGGRALLLIPPGRVRGDALGPVVLGFTPIFWNTACTQRQAPHTLGVALDPAAPAFARFPTDAHTNWQWWHVVTRAAPLLLEGLPPALRPLITVVDDWYTNRRLALAVETRVGRGRVLVCSVDLGDGGPADPVLRQLRRSLLDYVAGERFEPAVELTPAQLAGLVAPRAARRGDE